MWDGTVSGMEFHAETMAFLALWSSADTSRYHWQWQPWADSTAGGYLTLEDVPMPTARVDSGGQLTLEASDSVSGSVDPPSPKTDYAGDPADIATLVFDSVSINQHASFTYHVIYSESYKVPTLFFRGFHADGGMLSIQDVQKILTADSLLLLEKSPWTFLTQEEHPVLHRPWFSFHPCGTSNMMALILSDWLRSTEKFNTTQHRQSLSSHDDTQLPDMPKTSGAGVGNMLQLEPSRCSGKYLLTWLSIVGQVARFRSACTYLKPFPWRLVGYVLLERGRFPNGRLSTWMGPWKPLGVVL